VHVLEEVAQGVAVDYAQSLELISAKASGKAGAVQSAASRSCFAGLSSRVITR
jgi:hypothetical protein